MQKYFVLTKFFRMFLFKILITFKKLFTISKKCFRFKNCLQFSKNVHEFLNIFVLYFLHVFNFCSRIQKMFNFQICLEFLKLFSVSNFGLKMFLFPFRFLFSFFYFSSFFSKKRSCFKNCS